MCICCHVIILHPRTAFYVLNNLLNFHNWFRIFWHQHFGFCCIWRPNFWQWMGVKCEICNVDMLFPKGTSLAQNTDNTPTEMCRLVRLGETKARKRQGKKHCGNWLFAQTTHIVGLKLNFTCGSSREIVLNFKFHGSWLRVLEGGVWGIAYSIRWWSKW